MTMDWRQFELLLESEWASYTAGHERIKEGFELLRHHVLAPSTEGRFHSNPSNLSDNSSGRSPFVSVGEFYDEKNFKVDEKSPKVKLDGSGQSHLDGQSHETSCLAEQQIGGSREAGAMPGGAEPQCDSPTLSSVQKIKTGMRENGDDSSDPTITRQMMRTSTLASKRSGLDSKRRHSITRSNMNAQNHAHDILLSSSDTFQVEMPQRYSMSLPSGKVFEWPSGLALREELLTPVKTNVLTSRGGQGDVRPLMGTDDASDEEQKPSIFPIHPNSAVSLIYSMMIVILLGFDLTAVPVVLAWSVEMTGFLLFTQVITPILWTIDVGVNFNKGFFRGAELHMSYRAIAEHYARGWLLPDLIIVGCDWISTINILMSEDSSSESGSLRMSQLAKFGRMLRAIGMFRVLRLAKIIEEWAEQNVSEGWRLAIKVLAMHWAVLWGAHILTCLWFALGTSSGMTDTGHSWADDAGMSHNGEYISFMDLAVTYQYFTSFHWASAQITLSSADMFPKSSMERIVNIIAIMIGFILGSTVISILSASMVEFFVRNKDRMRKIELLRRYLAENGVGIRTSSLVLKHAQERLKRSERLSDKDVQALLLLPTSLQRQLRVEIMLPTFMKYPLAFMMTTMNDRVTKVLCVESMEEVMLRPDDDLFVPGISIDSMFIVVQGELQYKQTDCTSEKLNQGDVRIGQWLCEPALWSEWSSVGEAGTAISTQVLRIRAECFHRCLIDYPMVHAIVIEYGVQFHKRLVSAGPLTEDQPSDLMVPFTDFCDIVVSISSESQIQIGKSALHQIARTSAAHRLRSIETLAKEVRTGKSVVVMTDPRHISRLVELVLLRVCNHDGCIFAQVGEVSNGKVRCQCELPGGKCFRDEKVMDTIERILKTKLGCLVGKSILVNLSNDVEEKVSSEHGVHTKYLKSIANMSFKENEMIMAPSCSMEPMDELLLKRFSGRSSDSKFLMEHADGPVFAVADSSNKVKLFAWLRADEMELLRSASGESVLDAWLSLAIPPESVVFDESEAVKVAVQQSTPALCADLNSSGNAAPLPVLDEEEVDTIPVEKALSMTAPVG